MPPNAPDPAPWSNGTRTAAPATDISDPMAFGSDKSVDPCHTSAFQKGGPIGPNAANSCRLRLQGKCPVRSRSRQRAEVAVAVNARRQHQNGDAVERRARSANRCVPGAWFASTCNRREIPTIPYGWAKWKALSLACSRWRGARNLARALGAAYRAQSAWRGGRTDVRGALEQGTREVAAR